MKTYEEEKHDLARDYAREIPGHDEEMAFRHGFDAGHARAQVRIKELEGDCQRKDSLLMIAKKSIDDSNKYLKLRFDEIQYLQTKLESCEKLKDDFAQLNHTLCHDLTVAKAENKRLEIDFQNNYRWRVEAVQKLKVSIPIADVKPLVEALEYYHKGQCTWIDGSLNIAPAENALQTFREKHKEILK